MAEAAIRTTHLAKVFKRKEVIKDCNMEVKRGTIYGFLGKNGAGKTTVLKLLLGLLKPTSGSAYVLGMDSVKDNLSVLKRTGNIIEAPVFYEHLSANDNLKIHLDYMGAASADIDKTLKRVGLDNVRECPVSEFSLGMRQRLALARAIIHKPEVLILDEPINGMDPIGIKDIRELLISLSKQNGVTTILSSHILSEIENIADTIGFIDNGTIVKEIETQEIREQFSGSLEDYFISIINGGNSNE